jgi:phosphoketolase
MVQRSESIQQRGTDVIRRTQETRIRLAGLASTLGPGSRGDGPAFTDLLAALDRICRAAMWIVVHQTYARNVYLDGRPLQREDFKPRPEGHTGGSLNMVPAYAGYLAANVVSGFTRSWLMGQGHCVAAVDSLNLLVDNMTAAHRERYSVTDDGLTRYVRDFYSYLLRSDGRPDSPVGSHVNAHTAGGISEGGYLGFAELQYVHMPLPGERLVVFLSDGAFEEQRGSDWAPRWWRAEDSGWVLPIMIKNGRRIDQRTTMTQQGGAAWFRKHLQLNGFDPFVFDGRDPAAFLWAILEMERRLAQAVATVRDGKAAYPVRLPYAIALAPKGAGFPGEGTNLAHNLPLMANPYTDPNAAARFNAAARRLWVPPDELRLAIEIFQRHSASSRPRERDHPLVNRDPQIKELAVLPERPVDESTRNHPANWTYASPMEAADEVFAALAAANPDLRPRVGNPDEMRSNRLIRTLETLKFRVTDAEPGIPESVQGSVITALNEEAVVSAALANKGGINLVHTYEAFGPKMHGAVRQEIIFARTCVRAGRPQNWLSIPVIMTSDTWENGKNEHSHQDPSFAEAMMGEPAPFSRVLFPPDFNTASAVMDGLYRTRGQIWTLVLPKASAIPIFFTPREAKQLLDDGAMALPWAAYRSEEANVVLGAVGAYQLREVLHAAQRLREREVPHSVVYLLEPCRTSPDAIRMLFNSKEAAAVLLTHTRPHILWGLLGPLMEQRSLVVLGYRNEGGTLDTPGMLMVNGCTWAHCLRAVAEAISLHPQDLLTQKELAALAGGRNPQGVIIPFPGER